MRKVLNFLNNLIHTQENVLENDRNDYDLKKLYQPYVKLVITDQVFGAVMGTCVGDALGVPVEFVNRNLLTASPSLE
ncbi:ADP-ribosylglycohydrolase family protein [Paenibacillus polymyxa]|uniref:ADP-ribosylglycohydrolase family protein n=1 Tax=Paenibacillus polymyxa TaxID=1406 RepID=UPI00202594DC|nr:ADP-ribosylglycohydrolase family protein [Paenibacillus polymyxa]URJ46968.1 ADP-ribosylglycohydrolase family protein [Paenibacillus polymyxa]